MVLFSVIMVCDGFNPCEYFDEFVIKWMVQTMCESGVLQLLLV